MKLNQPEPVEVPVNSPPVISSLNGIRGYALLLVLLSHASNHDLYFSKWLSFSGAGRYGVFLFFVLSSFLLTRQFLHLDFKRSDKPKILQRYFLRRFLRIYPLYTIALIVYLLINKMGFPIYKLDTTIVIKSLLLIDAKGIFWAIPVEFQYYFIIPFISYFYFLLRNNYLAGTTSTLLLIAFFSFLFPPKYTANVLPFLSIFIFGSFCAYTEQFINSNPKLLNYTSRFYFIFNIICLISFTSFIFLTPNFLSILFQQSFDRKYFHEQFVLFGFLSFMLVFSTLYSKGYIKTLMNNPVFSFYGKISFSAYLGHMIILQLISKFTNTSPAAGIILLLSLTTFFSYLSYTLIERPLSRIQTLDALILSLRYPFRSLLNRKHPAPNTHS